MTQLSQPHRPELLAPAGTMEALLAALGSGADAVYLGLDKLNARGNAGNFTLENLPQACAYAHIHGARVYLTVNVVILPHEMNEALELIDSAWACGVDAVIIQDLGLIKVLSEVMPHVRIHASTQMNIHSAESVRALAAYGVKRVTLSRETNVQEIETLSAAARELGVEIESFVHGAICVCYSGQCFFSSMVGRRSANRGQCAQPCRLAYTLVDKDEEERAVVGPHLLSPKDLAGIEHIEDFRRAGVSSLKIEGRMKSPAYVAAVVSVYREALESAPGEFDIEAAYARLAEAFSRGFTPAYLEDERGNDMMSYTRPNNRGSLIGRIGRLEGDTATITLDKDLATDDVLEIWTQRGRFTQEAGSLELDGELVEFAPAGSRVELALEGSAGKGDRVFRVRSSALGGQARAAIERARSRRQSLAFEARLRIGEPLMVRVTDQHGISGEAHGPIVEAARTKEITKDEVIKHLDRLGATLYTMQSSSIELDSGVGLSFSAIHKARAAALLAYETNRFFSGVAREQVHPLPPALSRHKAKNRSAQVGLELTAVTETSGGANAALNAGAARAYVAAYNLLEEEPRPDVWPVLPRVSHDREIDTYMGVAQRYGRAVCSTLGQLRACKALRIPAQAHWSLNATNPYTVNALAEMGATFVWLSPELSGKQIAAIARHSDVGVGIALGGLSEVMVTEHCILMSMGPCNQNCAACARRREVLALKDRLGYHFRVMTDITGRSHLYNSVPLDLSDAIREIIDAGVSAVRLDLETALTSSVAHEVALKRAAIVDTLAGREIPKADKALTRGHFYRGVL